MGVRASLAHSFGSFVEIRNLNTGSSSAGGGIEIRDHVLGDHNCLGFRKWRDRGQLKTRLLFKGKVLSHGNPRVDLI